MWAGLRIQWPFKDIASRDPYPSHLRYAPWCNLSDCQKMNFIQLWAWKYQMKFMKEVKVWHSEECITQHKSLVCDFKIRKVKGIWWKLDYMKIRKTKILSKIPASTKITLMPLVVKLMPLLKVIWNFCKDLCQRIQPRIVGGKVSQVDTEKFVVGMLLVNMLKRNRKIKIWRGILKERERNKKQHYYRNIIHFGNSVILLY